MASPQMPKTAMVFAAGLGARMRPITDSAAQAAGQGRRQGADRPLPRPFRRGRRRARDRQCPLARRPDRGASGLRADARRSSFRTSARRLLDQGGGIKRALPLIGDAPFFLCNTDAFWIEGPRSNLRRLAAAFDPERMDAVLLVASSRRRGRRRLAGRFLVRRGGPSRAARGPPCRALRLYRRRHHQAGTVRRRDEGCLPPRAVLLRGRAQGPPLRPASRRALAACRTTGGDR